MFSTIRFYRKDNDRKTMGILNNITLHLKGYCENKEDKLEAARYFASNVLNGIPHGTQRYESAKSVMRKEMREWRK